MDRQKNRGEIVVEVQKESEYTGPSDNRPQFNSTLSKKGCRYVGTEM